MGNLHTPCSIDTCVKLCYTLLMKHIISAKLKLHTNPEQYTALRATQLAYRNALNAVSQYAFEHGKMSSARALQRDMYDCVRTVYKLPAQMACNVPRQVAATYKGLWTRAKQNAASRQAGRTRKRYKGLDQAPKYVSPTLTYNYQRDYSFKRDAHVSILTLEGRVVVPYTGYDKHVSQIRKGAQIGAARLWYDKPKKQFYLLVSLEIEVADPTPETHKGIVGVDIGVRYLAVTATTKGGSTFHTGKAIVPKANHYARLRKRLQKKGTRSAIRRLVAISQRERRLKADANHRVSKRIVTQHPNSLIGLEDLTHIRERTRRRKGKHASQKQRRANAAYSKWSFAELQAMIAYKALTQKSMAIKVDAHYTSKACPMCGHTSDGNRPHKGLLFVCQNCHYTLHADLVGARNIAMRTLLIRQDWVSTGTLSECPDVSSVEAKAARLSRYAELRWNSDASPGL
jgi:IS605 OrfB family transposase